VKYAERIGLKLSLDFHSKVESHSRNYYYEAECPAIGTGLTQSISCRPIELNFNLIIHFLFLQEIVKDVTLIFISKDSIQEETYYNQSSCFNKIPIVFIVFNYEKILHLKKFENQFLQELQQLCYQSIDHFLIPFRFYCISSFPRPKNNEDLIDEEKLQQLALQFIQKEHQVNLPKTNLEKEIEMLWKQQIIDPSSTSSSSLPLFSIKASFFELGGDSLSAGKIVNAMKRHFQVSLTISDLLNASTIEEMAKKIDSLLLMKSQKMGGKENLLYNSLNNHTRSTCSMSNSTDDHDHQEKLTGASSVRFLTNENKASFPSYQFLTTPSTDEQDHLENVIHTGHFTSGDTKNATNSTENLDPTSFAATNRWVLFVQSLPITFIVPLRRAIIWFVMITIWIEFMASTSFQLERFYSLLFAILLTRIAVMLIGPLFAILIKWLIIGKYQEGKNYPIWGSMYLKWWIVEQILEIMGKGIFQYHSKLLLLYYRLLGMNISIRSNIKISNSCKFGSVVDLIEIQDNVLIENSTIIRPFVINQHGKTFSLKSIVIEKNSSIGMKSVIAAGSIIPANTHIGPLSSSHEYDDTSNSSVKNLKYCQLAFPSPPFLWKAGLGYPILLIVLIVTYLPWYFILRAMVIDAHESGWYNQSIISIYDAIIWWITPKRIFYFYLLRMTRHCVVPFIRLFMTILIKWLIIGKFKEIFNEEERSLAWNCFQSWLMSRLLSPGEGPDGGLCGVAGLIGTHYETISIIYRLFGAKIGKRIYWPGSGLSNVIEFDLLTIEDDVVFGSRSIFLFSTTTQRKSILIKKGAMIADRCVILPGVIIGRKAMIGTGSLICEDMKVERETTWIGSQNGQPLNFSSPSTRIKSKNHSAEQFESKDIEDPRGFPHTDNCEDNDDDDDHDDRDEELDQGEFPSPSSTVTPFGKAFYRREANYFVIPLWGVVLYNFLWHAICTW
jgi:acetyltransferase-like isoleucine patch superfamily enzyme